MKKLFYTMIILAFLTACGSKDKTAETLTNEEETQLVDSISQHLEEHTRELKQKTDSVSAEVDSILEGI